MTESLDIVMTVYRDAPTIASVVDSVESSARQIGMPYRVILVCDGDLDGSWEVVSSLASERASVTGLLLSRNFGQHIAVSAGLDVSEADFVIVMDSDLQDPPAAISSIIRELRAGNDLVYVRRREYDVQLIKRMSSRIFWSLIRFIAGKSIVSDQQMMRGMSRRFVRAFSSLREHQRFIGGLSAWLGFRSTIIEAEASTAVRGSTYSLGRLLRLAVDATTSLSILPLRFATFLGFAMTVVSFAYGIYVLLAFAATGDMLAGFPSLALLITGMSGVQLLILGILGEYVGRTLRESQLRPLYLVQDWVGAVPQSASIAFPLPPSK